MVGERLDEVRVGLLDRLERHPLLADVEVDERQVAARDDDEVRGLHLLLVVALRGRRARRRALRRHLGVRRTHLDLAVLRAAARDGARERSGEALGLRDLAEERVELAPVLDLCGRGGDRGLATHQRADDVLEGHAVALEERGAEALAVVGQDDEAIRPRRVLGGLAQRLQLAVDAIERVERFRALGPAVVGDLVVVGVVHVDDRRAADHLLDDERGAQRPQRHVRGAAHPGVREAAVMAMEGPDARTLLAPRLDVLLDDLARGTS